MCLGRDASSHGCMLTRYRLMIAQIDSLALAVIYICSCRRGVLRVLCYICMKTAACAGGCLCIAGTTTELKTSIILHAKHAVLGSAQQQVAAVASQSRRLLRAQMRRRCARINATGAASDAWRTPEHSNPHRMSLHIRNIRQAAPARAAALA